MSRTSLADFQDNVKEFVDTNSLAKYENASSEIVIKENTLLYAFDIH